MTVPVLAYPTGTTRALEQVTLRARVRGFLTERHFDEGSSVKKGQLLLVIDEEPYKVALDSALAKQSESEAAVKKAEQSRGREVATAQLALDVAQSFLAQIEERRSRSLLQRNAGTREDLDKAEADRKKYDAQVEADRASLDQARSATPWGQSSTSHTITFTGRPRSTEAPPPATVRDKPWRQWKRSPRRSCPRSSASSGPGRRSRNKRPVTWRFISSASWSSASSYSWRHFYESWIRPTVILLTVPLAMFGAAVGLWLYDLPLDVFSQIGLVMLIGLETKNAILLVEFAVELRRKHGASVIESAKVASRERLRPILMTSFAFVMGSCRWPDPPAPGPTAGTCWESSSPSGSSSVPSWAGS